MRCKACDVLLMEHEFRRKTPVTDEYPDLCDSCWELSMGDWDSEIMKHEGDFEDELQGDEPDYITDYK